MKYIITGRNLAITDSLRDAVEKKLGKLDRFFNPETVVYVTMSVQKDTQKVEVTIPVKGRTIRAEQASSSMYVSIDLVEEVIERQLKKYKGQLTQRWQSGENFSRAFMELEVPAEEEEEEIKIAKVKKFAYKPMDPVEACLQMELLGHSFYVFTNSDTGATNVVYKRTDGTFGLIEPDNE
ncbi:MAG: ribosome hibernation-promoting factor, HPF/YfiA family [Lachnospiraceae bacterium]|jgi:putative sigma-54 modulation protein